MPQFHLSVNGTEHEITAAEDTPLIYALRNQLGLKGTRFGCGTGQCGACYVLIDGRAVPACDTPLWAAAGKRITTVEGPGPRRRVRTRCNARSSPSRPRNAATACRAS